MHLRQWFRPPRRLLALFLTMTLALAAGFVWLGTRLVGQERMLVRHRLQERLSHTSEIVTLELKSALDRVDRRLERLGDSPAPPANGDSRAWGGDLQGATFVLLEPTGVRAWPAEALAYYPVVREDVAKPADTVARGLLQEAASLRLAGRHDAALATYDRLIATDASVLGVPAVVVGHHARCRVLDELRRSDELMAEAQALALALRRQPWRLTSGTYAFYAGEVGVWLEADRFAGREPEVRRAEARAHVVSRLRADWSDGAGDRTERLARVIRVGDQALTVIAHATGRRLAALLADAEFLDALLGQSLRLASNSTAVDVALVADGQLMAGRLPGTGRERMERMPEETGLPWTVYVAPGEDWTTEPASADRQRLLLLGIAVVGACALGAAVATARAVHRELEVARLQSDFVAAVSHEFRTPLAAVSQLAEMLAEHRVADEGQRQEYYARLQRESARLRRLVEDLLDFRRMEAGAHEYRFEIGSPAVLLRQALAEMTTDQQMSGRLRIEIDDDLPAIRADQEAITRAVRNLVDNAVKYSPRSGVIWITAVRTPAGVAMSVRDEGPGIPQGRQREIFEKFVRATGAAAVPGTGLGLAMVRQIVRAHGGSVELQSEPGRGSTFTVHLPSV